MVRYLHDGIERTGRIVYHTPVSAVIVSRGTKYRIPIQDIIEPASQYYQRWFFNATLTGVVLWLGGLWAMVTIVAIIMFCKAEWGVS